MTRSELLCARPAVLCRFARWLGLRTGEPRTLAEHSRLVERVRDRLRVTRVPRDGRPHYLPGAAA